MRSLALAAAILFTGCVVNVPAEVAVQTRLLADRVRAHVNASAPAEGVNPQLHQEHGVELILLSQDVADLAAENAEPPSE